LLLAQYSSKKAKWRSNGSQQINQTPQGSFYPFGTVRPFGAAMGSAEKAVKTTVIRQQNRTPAQPGLKPRRFDIV
jgi:hypothetical protein